MPRAGCSLAPHSIRPSGQGSRVWGSEFEVEFRGEGLRFGAHGAECRVQGSGCRVRVGSRVESSGLRA